MKGNERKNRQMSESASVMAVLTVSGGLQDAYSCFVRGQAFANAQTGNADTNTRRCSTGVSL